MSPGWPLARATRVGIALGRDQLLAVLPGDAPSAPWIRPLSPFGDPDGEWPALARTLGDLRAAVSAASPFRSALHVALLPPLAHLRRVELPGLRVSEARSVLAREPSRYLPLPADAPPLALEIEGEGWRQSSPFTLFAVPRALIDAIDAAARQSGWRVAEIVAAESAWAASASSLLPGAAGMDRVLAVRLDDRVDIVRARRGRIVSMRRFPPGAPGVGPLLLSLPRGAIVDAGSQRSPAALAAAFAPRAAGPALLPDEDRIAMQHRAKRASIVRFAAAAALVVAAAGLQLWGASLEEARIAAERARLREQVSRALATRDSLTQAVNRLTVLRAAARSAPRWSSLIASLSAALPDDAFLVSLSVGSDTLHLEGSAARAAGVFDALGSVRGVRTVRPEGPIRQEMMEDGTATEHFTLSAQLEKRP